MRPNTSLISKLLRLAIVEILPEIKRDWSKRGCYDQLCEQLGYPFSSKISCFRSLGISVKGQLAKSLNSRPTRPVLYNCPATASSLEAVNYFLG